VSGLREAYRRGTGAREETKGAGKEASFSFRETGFCKLLVLERFVVEVFPCFDALSADAVVVGV
jgi:hypothetical protein